VATGIDFSNIRVKKSRKIIWAEHVAQKTISYVVMVAYLQGKKLLGNLVIDRRII
jgi:hypothetical protein